MEKFIDLHCHPSIKPFGQAFPGNTNSADASMKNSIWHNDPPSAGDIASGRVLTVTRYSQADFTSLFRGGCRVAVVALNPVEKEFFTSKAGSGRFADFLYDFATGIGRKKVDFIQQNRDDFNELSCEYDFYKQLDGVSLIVFGKKVVYKLVTCYSDIVSNMSSHDYVLSVIPSIEGGYVLNNDNSSQPDPARIFENIVSIKQWPHPPLFITLCHHFYNHLGGHSKSLPGGFISKVIDQGRGLDTGLTPLGADVIRQFLGTANGRRIFIDIRHMSRRVRVEYYDMLKSEFAGENIPVIASHGAVNGYPEVGSFSFPQKEKNGKFLGREINFYDDEIILIAETGGLLGIELDQRNITNKRELRKIKYLCWSRRRREEKLTGLIWNQIRYIADLLDSHSMRAWDITCMGTDFDGMISPVNGYLTAADMPSLYKNLRKHAEEYLAVKAFTLLSNRLTAEQILNKVFHDNAVDFLSRSYN